MSSRESERNSVGRREEKRKPGRASERETQIQDGYNASTHYLKLHEGERKQPLQSCGLTIEDMVQESPCLALLKGHSA